MKRFFILIFCVLVSGVCFAYLGDYGEADETEVATAEDTESKVCPKTRISDNSRCSDCHVLIQEGDSYRYGIREVEPYSHYRMPYHTSVVDGKLTYYLEDVTSMSFAQFVRYAKRHPEFGRHLVVEVDSYGGSIFEAWRIKALMVEMERAGYIIETRTRGVALSAGFIIFVSGTRGFRSVDGNAEFMMHELWGIEWPKIATPASKEEEARVFRHLQDNINEWISTRGNMTKEEIDHKLKFKEAWLTGTEMVEYQFADKYIGE